MIWGQADSPVQLRIDYPFTGQEGARPTVAAIPHSVVAQLFTTLHSAR